MKKLFTILALTYALSCFMTSEVNAQTAVGIRLGSPVSLSLKLRPNEAQNAIELFVGYRSDKVNTVFGNSGWTSISVGGLYQIHKDLDIGDLDGLQYYYGAGASAFIWSYDDGFTNVDDYGSVSFGVLGNAGLDYIFPNNKINVSLDWMPRVFLGSGFNTGIGFGYGALSARFVLGQ